jgi:hypothetical protein
MASTGCLVITGALLIQDFGGDATFVVFAEFDGRDLLRLVLIPADGDE